VKRRNFLSFSVAAPLLTSAAAWGAEEEPPELDEDTKPVTISTGQKVTLSDHLAVEKPTIFLFYRTASRDDNTLLKPMFEGVKTRAGFRVIDLKTGEEPVAQQYEIKQMPTILVYDRRGRLVARTTSMAEVPPAFLKARRIMRIDWAEEGSPEWEDATKRMGRPPGAGILRTMTLKPEYLEHINAVANVAHFKDGFLTRRTKEMIATYVSALNKCKY
jgi:hypothetical protein